MGILNPTMFQDQNLGDEPPPVGKDPDNMLRIWANREGTLERLKNHVISGSFDAVYIQFHFAYFDLFDLARLLQAVHAAGIDTYLALHRTRDHDLFKASLREIADTLKTCTRLFVHGLEDVNRFKEMGVIDNVVLLPPGLAAPPAIHLETARGLLGLQRFSPIVGTFGFLAPHKGFQAVIQAFALVLRDYPEALLLMATAQNGNADSAEECERCRAAIRDLGLQGSVIMITDFIEDEEEAIFLLSSCDAIVFGYQYSMEAASGAIRIGLASGRPVGGTPLPIFSEFAGLIHRFEGTGPQDILVGLRTLLDAGYPREEVMRKQRSWMASHSWAAQARRIGNIMRGCFEERHSVELRPVGLSTEEANT